MELFYISVFGALAAVVAALELSKTSKDRINTSSAFNSFKNNYLLVYSLMMGTDLPFFAFSVAFFCYFPPLLLVFVIVVWILHEYVKIMCNFALNVQILGFKCVFL